jgi:UDP-N-acetylglucosamine--N-acetylmuramyl-(pentapeptide) pyrophosphoryl-undecaprenol N-acetylglucosamine transferase
MTTVLFAGGGTGGHLMPALAIAEEMVRLDPAVQPYFVGSLRGIEASVLPQRPWEYELLPLEPLWRRRWWRNVRLPVTAARAYLAIRAILRRRRPRLVVGTGGYVSGPVVWAALRGGVPAVLQEQNAYPGLATRRLSARVAQVHLGFPEARAHLPAAAAVHVFDSGNPIQPPPAPGARPSKEAAKTHLGLAADRPLVLVIGGSQGARAINEAVSAALDAAAFPARASLLWQTGAVMHAGFAPYGAPGRVRVEPFIDPMSEAYGAADLVVARAGAMTIAELAAWGLPSILIPLPTAAAGHQHVNAAAMAAAGASVLLEQRNATGTALAALVGALLADPARMADLGMAAKRRARPDAVSRIASDALKAMSKT